MFRGHHTHAIDAKGRVSFPSRFRDQLVHVGDQRLVLTPSLFDACIHVFPLKAWETLESNVSRQNQFDPKVVLFRRRYVSAAVDCELDAQGRVLVPPQLRAHAGITKDIVWAGVLDKVELWAQERWEQETRVSPEDLSELRMLISKWEL